MSRDARTCRSISTRSARCRPTTYGLDPRDGRRAAGRDPVQGGAGRQGRRRAGPRSTRADLTRPRLDAATWPRSSRTRPASPIAKLDAARYAKLVASNYSSAQQSDTARAQVAQERRPGARRPGADRHGADAAELRHHLGADRWPGRPAAGRHRQSSSIPATPRRSRCITQLQPISVLFTLPQQDLRPSVAQSMQGGMPEVRRGEGPVPTPRPAAPPAIAA